jgi:1-aminocyclopropane-1-carboxylate deaminase/D-cysteine desulfhydrase-like pyridoxal-dependent ACC family enzyme
MNHLEVSGNKWWKLKYNLEEAVKSKSKTLLSFGGHYSNHIYAVAGAASILGMKSVGIIRGEEVLPLNATLAYARSRGMTIHYVSREAYRLKSNEEFLLGLLERFGDSYVLPEGGTNALAVKGCREFGEKLAREVKFDIVALAVGTGGTLAGIIGGMQKDRQVIGFSVLKGGGFLEEEVRRWINPTNSASPAWRIETRYHFGGYARITQELRTFIDVQRTTHQLPLDHVYTAKALYGLFDMIQGGEIARGSTVLMIHTGGLQGTALAE